MDAPPKLRRTEGVVMPIPAPTGYVILGVVALGILESGSRTIAIGVLIALGIMATIDFAISAAALRSRSLEVEPVRRFAASPDQKITFTGTIDVGGFDVRVIVRRMSRHDRDTGFAMASTDVSRLTLELGAMARKTRYIRHRTECSVFGLAWARRYVSREVLPLHVAPGPDRTLRIDVRSDDDITRLREYVPGDRISRISWPTTARTGRLHVRSEDPVDPEVTVLVDLGPDLRGVEDEQQPSTRPTGEATLAVANAVVTELLRQGRIVRLVTTSLRDAFHRAELEAALEHPYLWPRVDLVVRPDASATLAGEPATEVVSGIVTDDLELIRRLSTTEHAPSVPVTATPYVLVDPEGVRWIR